MAKEISGSDIVYRNESSQSSRHKPEERGLYLNWLKQNRKMMNAGKMKEERVALFLRLLELGEKNKHVNQYV